LGPSFSSSSHESLSGSAIGGVSINLHIMGVVFLMRRRRGMERGGDTPTIRGEWACFSRGGSERMYLY